MILDVTDINHFNNDSVGESIAKGTRSLYDGDDIDDN
jgi:hypothetical protein